MDNTAYDSLCTACTNIFSDNTLDRLYNEQSETEWKFHSTLESMIASEHDGCRLCALILPTCNAHGRPMKRMRTGALTDSAQSLQWKYKLALFSKPNSPSSTDRECYVLSFFLDSTESTSFTACITTIV